MKGNDAVLQSLCKLFLELEKSYESLQGTESNVKRAHGIGTLSDFSFALEMEDVRRQYGRLAAALVRLRHSYELVKAGGTAQA